MALLWQFQSKWTKALTWYDSGFSRRGSDGHGDVHSGGFVQRWLNHARHVLLVVGIFWLLGHFLQVGAGKGVHGDAHASASLDLTLVLPKAEEQIWINMAWQRLREHMLQLLVGFARLFSTWKCFAENSHTVGKLTESTVCDFYLRELLNQHPNTTLRGTVSLKVTLFYLMRLGTEVPGYGPHGTCI